MQNDFSKYRVVTLDCYGTLIDWETGIWDALQPILATNQKISVPKHEALKFFADFESYQQRKFPTKKYSDILRSVHHRLAEHYGFETTTEFDQRFGQSKSTWPPFIDSCRALHLLQSRYKLVILSNVHRKGFEASNHKLKIEFDAVYTAEDIGSYKPDLRNFEYMLRGIRDSFGFDKSDVLHVAQSLYHDHDPASKVGLASVWIDRNKHSSETTSPSSTHWGATSPVLKIPRVDFIFNTMQDFSKAVFHGYEQQKKAPPVS